MTTTTRPTTPEPPATAPPATRRRRRNAWILPPPASNEEKRANGSQPTADATNGSADTIDRDFASAQQAGLTAIIRLAEAKAPPGPLFLIGPRAPWPKPPASTPDQAVSATAAQPVQVIVAPTPVMDRPVVGVHPSPVTSGRLPATRAHTSRERKSAWHEPRVLLLCILVVQAALALRLVWSNTAFMDEALYLWAGHMEIAHLLNGSTIPAFSTYFSGAPVIYPVVGAIADAYGGLVLTRLLSMAFMLASTALLYAATGRLFGRKAALAAASVFAVLGPVQVLGAFATFDSMSIFLLALSSWLVIRAQGPLSEPFLLAAGLVMALADAAKYASVLWDPVIIILAALTASHASLLRSALRGVRLIGYTLGALAIAAFQLGGHAYVRGILFTTLLRRAGGTPASTLTVFESSFNWVGIVFVLAVIGLGISFSEGIRTRLLCSTLLVAILLAPAEQARIHILTSLHKHVVFGVWFAAMVAGYALGRATEVNKAQGWRVVAAAVGISAFLGIPQANAIYRQWPSSSEMISDIAPVLAKTHCPCLVTENNVVNYYLLRQTISDKFIGAFSFYYWDGPESRVLHGLPAYTKAIASHYFRVVEVDPNENPAIYGPVTRALAAADGWRLIDRIPSGTPRKPFEIWRYGRLRSDSGPRH